MTKPNLVAVAEYLSIRPEDTRYVSSLLRVCKVLAQEAHRGQMYGTEPYMAHVSDVVCLLLTDSTFQATPFDLAVAWLHDVLEDSEYTADDLLAFGIPADVVRVVEVLTRREGETYGDYIQRVRKDVHARRVKIADVRSHLGAAVRMGGKGDLKRRYLRALHQLR